MYIYIYIHIYKITLQYLSSMRKVGQEYFTTLCRSHCNALRNSLKL